MKKREELYSFPQQKDGAVVETDIRMIPLEELQDFEGHPFKVENAGVTPMTYMPMAGTMNNEMSGNTPGAINSYHMAQRKASVAKLVEGLS